MDDRKLVSNLLRAVDENSRRRNARMSGVEQMACAYASQTGALQELLVMALRNPEYARARIEGMTAEESAEARAA